MSTKLIAELLDADDPTIRYKTRVNVLGEKPRTKKLRALRAEIADSPRVTALLSERNREGKIERHPYSKWSGAHWVLYALAELEYPTGDASLLPLREQAFAYLDSENYTQTIRRIKGITRIHASIDANAIWYLHKLGLADERVGKLVARLLETQWRDGGWNCDARAKGNTSSFFESLLPLRALVLHSQVTGDQDARRAAERCAEIFLKRHLFRRVRTGNVMDPRFLLLHYPCYWHYDILLGLKVLWEGGWLDDPRCNDALDFLASKQLRAGGWALDAKYYRHTRAHVPSGRSLIEWGAARKNARNDFVTVDALTILRASGRMRIK